MKFPLDLDATSFCTPELKQQCEPVKTYLAQYEERIATLKKVNKKIPPSTLDEAAILLSLGVSDVEEGTNPSGQYELAAVLTHMGRTADSGHYMGWIRYPDSDIWCMFI